MGSCRVLCMGPHMKSPGTCATIIALPAGTPAKQTARGLHERLSYFVIPDSQNCAILNLDLSDSCGKNQNQGAVSESLQGRRSVLVAST